MFSSAVAQQTPEQILRQASEYYLKGEFQPAVELYNDFLASYPQNVDVYDLRGLCYIGLKNYGRAIEDFSSSIAVKRSSSMSYVYRASAYIAQQNYISAQKDYEDAIFYDVNNIEAYYGLNFLYLRNNQYERSLAVLDKAIALEPKTARGFFMKAITYTFMGDTNKIFENILEGLYWDSTYFMKNTKKDLIFVMGERYKFAVDLFTKQIKEMPGSYLPYFNRGVIYYMMGNYDKASEDLKKSKSVNLDKTKLYLDATEKLLRSCYRVD